MDQVSIPNRFLLFSIASKTCDMWCQPRTTSKMKLDLKVRLRFFCSKISFRKANRLWIWFWLESGIRPTSRQQPPTYMFLRVIWLPTVRSTPDEIIPILEHSTSASYIEWVVSRMDRFSLHFEMISQICLRLSGSSPVVGSSRKIILGRPTILIAIESLLFIPPDNSQASLSLLSSRLTSVSAIVTFSCSSDLSTPFSRAQNSRWSSIDSSGQSRSNCGQTPIRVWMVGRSVFMLQPEIQASPLLDLQMPVSIDSRVVLPAPLGPNSPKIYPFFINRLNDLTASCQGLFPTLGYIFLSPLQ